MKKFQLKSGFSLVEILIATALFVVIMTAALNIFKTVIDSQRSAIATQNVEESLKYFLEVTGKEVRMAKRNNAVCPGAVNGIYDSPSESLLFFKNYHDECVIYKLSIDVNNVSRFQVFRNGNNGYITPATINIDELKFILRPETNTTQPTVTMELVAHALGKNSEKSTMKIQTTLTSRYYKTD